MSSPTKQPELPGTETAKHYSPKLVKRVANDALHNLRPQPRADEIDLVLGVLASDTKTIYSSDDQVTKAAQAKYKEMYPPAPPPATHPTPQAQPAHTPSK